MRAKVTKCTLHNFYLPHLWPFLRSFDSRHLLFRKEGRYTAIEACRGLADNVNSDGVFQRFVNGGEIAAATRDQSRRLEG